MAEHVWAAPADLFGKKQGYRPLPGDRTLKRWFAKSLFLPRQEAETDPTHRQWIPYVTLRRENDPGKIYVMKRHTGGGEVRLHERMTIGLGGHVNPIDETARGGPIQGALWRELLEEANLTPGDGTLEAAGMLVLSDNDVSRVHVGLHFWLWLPPRKTVRLNHEGGREGQWVTPKQLDARDERLETWSNATLLAHGWGARP